MSFKKVTTNMAAFSVVTFAKIAFTTKQKNTLKYTQIHSVNKTKNSKT